MMTGMQFRTMDSPVGLLTLAGATVDCMHLADGRPDL